MCKGIKNESEASKKEVSFEYSLEKLLEGMLSISQDEEVAEDERADVKYKRKILKNMGDLFAGLKGLDKKEMEAKILSRVESDHVLFPYTFFVASRPQFRYNWSYLRQQKDAFIDALYHSYVFLEDVVQQVQAMYVSFASFEALSVVFRDVIEVNFSSACQGVDVHIRWECFCFIFDKGTVPFLKAFYGHTLLLADSGKELDSFIQRVGFLMTIVEEKKKKAEAQQKDNDNQKEGEQDGEKQ